MLVPSSPIPLMQSGRQAIRQRFISHPPAVASTDAFDESMRWQERMGKDLPLSLLDMLCVSCHRIWGVSTFMVRVDCGSCGCEL